MDTFRKNHCDDDDNIKARLINGKARLVPFISRHDWHRFHIQDHKIERVGKMGGSCASIITIRQSDLLCLNEMAGSANAASI
jgi:hypothetical protein